MTNQEIFGPENRYSPTLERATPTKEGWVAEMEQAPDGEWIARSTAEQAVRQAADEVKQLRAALSGLLAEVQYAIQNDAVPVSWTKWDPPDLAIVTARQLVQRSPVEPSEKS